MINQETKGEIRVVKSVTNETYINLNDLIIDLMSRTEIVTTQVEKQCLKSLIGSLVKQRKSYSK